MKTTIKVAILTLFLASCTIMYRTNDVSSKVDQANAQAESFLTQAKANYNKISDLQKRLRAKRVNFKKEPFKTMNSNFSQMKGVLKKIAKMNAAMKSRGDALKKSLAGKDKISSKDPAYSIMREYKSYMEGASGEYNRLGGELNNLGNSYTRKAQQAGIHEVSAVYLRSQVDKGLAQIKQQSTNADSKIKWARTMLHRFPAEQRAQKKADLDEMESILGKISHETKTFSPLVRRFRKEVGTDEKVLVIPGMACHSIISELKKHVGIINGMAAQFNSVAQRFSAKK
jgi:hypothetical protein